MRTALSSDPKHAFVATMEGTHGQRLRRYLAVRLRNAAADVPDLMQEIFLRLLRIENHESIRNPQAYLYTIASHVLHQHTLKRAATPEAVDITDLAAEIEAIADGDPAEQVEMEQRFEELGRELQKLSPKAYATLVMHRRDGVPLKEVAVRLGVSYTMAKRYLARALSYCEQCLEDR